MSAIKRERRKSADKLTALEVGRLAKKDGTHHVGNGLYLQVRPDRGAASWVLRYMLRGRARTMGLGPLANWTLAEARERARQHRKLLDDGRDPIEERRTAERAAAEAAAKVVTFEEAARRYIASNEAGWRNAKHAAQWTATLKTYAFPVFGKVDVGAIDTGLVMKVLEPIWKTKTETASRVRQRVQAVLDWATANGHRHGANPARWKGHLDKILPQRTKVQKQQHFEAMPYAELPAFFADLSARNTMSARAMAWTILTAARSGETRMATVGELDLSAAVWTVPGSRTKSGREHRVPLTQEALAIVSTLGLGTDNTALLFPSASGKPLSDTAMRKYLQEEMKRPGLTVHGFRSSFRDWANECTEVAGEIAEAALSHVTGDATERAYRRGDALDRRRKLMEMWATFCTTPTPAAHNLAAIEQAS